MIYCYVRYISALFLTKLEVVAIILSGTLALILYRAKKKRLLSDPASVEIAKLLPKSTPVFPILLTSAGHGADPAIFNGLEHNQFKT